MPTSSQSPSPALSALQSYAEERALAAVQNRDKAAGQVTTALAEIQPSVHALGRFLDATHAAYAAEAWTRFRKQPVETAIMEMHHWNRLRGASTHPVSQLVEVAKAQVAHAVVEDLTRQGFLDAQALRIFVSGIHGLDG